MGIYAVDKLIGEARRLAAEFRRTTGKALPGVSGEIAAHDAARLLDLELCEDQPGGYDAVGRGPREGWRIQIKSRVVFDAARSGPRIGQLKLDKDWDVVMLVIMDENYEAVEILEASREAVEEALEDGAGASRRKRGAMSLARFRHIARTVWRAGEDDLSSACPGGR